MKKLLITAITSLLLLLSASPLALADNPAKGAIQCGVNGTAGVANGDCKADTNAPQTLGNLVASVINFLSVLVGAIAVIMLIIGGFRYITSAGNDTHTAAAKKTITYALIGLVIVAFAQVIVHFVINTATDTSNSNSPTNSSATSCGKAIC